MANAKGKGHRTKGKGKWKCKIPKETRPKQNAKGKQIANKQC